MIVGGRFPAGAERAPEEAGGCERSVQDTAPQSPIETMERKKNRVAGLEASPMEGEFDDTEWLGESSLRNGTEATVARRLGVEKPLVLRSINRLPQSR